MTDQNNQAPPSFEEVFRLKLPAPQKHVLMSMAVAVSADGVYRRGTTFLVLATEYSESQIKRIIASLTDLELIEQTEPSRGRKPACYKFHIKNGILNPALQNGYLELLRIQDEPLNISAPSQNGRVHDEYSGDIGVQDEPSTHSHARQNGYLNGAPAVQDSVAEGGNGRDRPDESVESYTEIPDIPERFSEDSTDSLPPKVLALTDVVFIDKPDKTGRQKVAWLIEKFGEPLVTAMLEHGAKLTGDARPVHVNWLVKSVKNAMLEGRTADQIRNRLGLRDAPPQQTYGYTNGDDDPDTLSYRLTHGPPPPQPEAPVPESLLVMADGKTRKDAWDAAYSQLEIQLDRTSFETWLRGAKLVDWRDGAYIIQARSSYARDMLEYRLYRNIARILADCGGGEVELRFVLAEREGV